jgi:CheY-like chemotaxis protein
MKKNINVAHQNSPLSELCHEIRNSLNGVIGYVSLLNGTKQNEEQTEYLAGLERSAQQITKILEVVSNDDAGHEFSQNNSKHFTMQQVILEAINIIRPDLLKKKLSLFYNASSLDLIKVFGNSTSIYQVILNLLINSIKFTKSGFIEIKLSCISESGDAIRYDFHSKIFLPHFKEESKNEFNVEGKGLGLNIIKKQIEKLDGEISLISYPGVGTCFNVNFLFSISDNQTLNTTNLPPACLNHNFPENIKYKILLVDDSDLNRTLLKRILELNNYCVVETGSYIDAVHAIELFDFDLLISDYILPQYNGIEIIKKFKLKLNNSMPSILLTALNDFEIESKIADGVFLKPVQPEVLLNTISNLIKSRVYA